MPITLDLDHFRARILQDALTQALAHHWEHRARIFDDAAPRAGDHHGHATPDELIDQAIRCKQAADNCRHHAQLITEPDPIQPDVWATIVGEIN